MRTKTLLIAAAALAAGVFASQAQSNVYSANVVGYVTATFAPAGQYTLVANPLDSGTNNLIGLLDQANTLPNKTQVLIWDPVGQAYVAATKIAGNWNTNLPIPPGTGFFVKTAATQATPITNTFVGNVIVSPAGGQTNVSVPAAYLLVGNQIPFNGSINDYQTGGTNTVNIGGVLPNKSQIQIWDVPSQSYVAGTKIAGNWNTNIALIPGQGYFLKSTGATNWTETLQIQ